MSGSNKVRCEFPIDFVVPWVDGSDPEWQKDKQKYLGESALSADSRDSRYKDWGLLKYWFRGVETFAPWVNKIFFITCGQVPDWMNLNAPKLVHIKHSDYMPQEYLPTFSANPIELNLHRIEGLSEHFVYFNDDLFLLNSVTPDYFFRKSLPVYPNELWPIIARRGSKCMANIYVNDISVINEHFKIIDSIRDDFWKWFSLRNHSWHTVFYNYLFFREGFIGFRNPHFAVPTLKSTMELVWKEEPDILEETSKRRFRDSRDVNQYLFRYWQYATNQFVPDKIENIGKYFELSENDEKICSAIRAQKYKQVCLNDMNLIKSNSAFEKVKNDLVSAFDSILPDKCSYEQ